jgi:hypothetical protein
MRRLFLFTTLLAVAAGCDESKKQQATTDAAIDPKAAAAIDPKLEKALASATDAGAAKDDKGPPPGGIFAPGAADALHAKGVPTKVEMGLEGAEPRITLGPSAGDGGAAAKPSGGGPARLVVATSMGRGLAMPTLELTLANSGASDTAPFIGEVKKVSAARDQRLPEGMEAELNKLVGSELRFKMKLDGRTDDPSVKLAKNAIPDLERLLTNAVEALMLAAVPAPPKPVGVGGVWMAETRTTWTGLDAVMYRAYKIKSIEGDKVSITFDAKQYAASRDVNLAGVPKGATLQQFEAAAKGEMELSKNDLMAKSMDLVQQTVMLFDAGDVPGQPPPPKNQKGEPQRNMATAQLQTEAKLVREGASPPKGDQKADNRK